MEENDEFFVSFCGRITRIVSMVMFASSFVRSYFRVLVVKSFTYSWLEVSGYGPESPESHHCSSSSSCNVRLRFPTLVEGSPTVARGGGRRIARVIAVRKTAVDGSRGSPKTRRFLLVRELYPRAGEATIAERELVWGLNDAHVPNSRCSSECKGEMIANPGPIRLVAAVQTSLLHELCCSQT